jgi:hypothetical protein
VIALLELLKEADAPDIKVIHGVCVCGSQTAFYQDDVNDKLSRPSLKDRSILTWI